MLKREGIRGGGYGYGAGHLIDRACVDMASVHILPISAPTSHSLKDVMTSHN